MTYVFRALAFLFGILLKPFHREWKKGDAVRCLLVGYSGANNTGAEAHAHEAIRQMRTAFKGRLEITVLSIDRERSLRYIKEDDSLRVVQVSSVFVFDVLKLITKSDLVILVEGYCFMENFSPALFWLFMYSADIAKHLKIPIVTYAVDAGVLRPSNSRWARKIADGADLLMLRTQSAADVLKKFGVKKQALITADPAFNFEPETNEWVEKKIREEGFDPAKPLIGIAFEEFYWWPVVPSLWKYFSQGEKDRFKSIYYHTWTEEKRAKSISLRNVMARFADWAASELGANVAFLSMERVNINPCRYVMNLMKTRPMLFDSDHSDARELAAIIANMKFIVTSEYHALLFAIKHSVPAIGLGHDERIESLMREAGLCDEYYIHYDEKGLEEKLTTKTKMLLLEENALRSHLKEILPSYLERADLSRIHFEKFMKKRF